MRSGRPGPVLLDLPFDVQMTEIDFDVDTYEPLAVHRPAATRAQVERALDLLETSERPLLVAGAASSTPTPPGCWSSSPSWSGCRSSPP